MININPFFLAHSEFVLNKNYYIEYNKYSKIENEKLDNFISNIGGTSFENGLFRIHTKGSEYIWSQVINEFFPFYKNKYTLFGYDWMGRHYAVSRNPFDKIIYMFDDSVNKVYELEQNIENFFNEDLVEYCDETLNMPIFRQLEIIKLDNEKCYSFKKPLSLGGLDEITNYTLSDMMVAWNINYQLHNNLIDKKEGQLINKINMSF